MVELVIVVALIGLLAVFAIPAFERYGNYSKLEQKGEEIKEFIKKTELLARNPESTEIKQYVLVVNGNNFEIKGCRVKIISDISADCGTTDQLNVSPGNPSEYAINLSQEIIPPSAYITCPTTPGEKCVQPSSVMSVFNSNSSRTVEFEIKTNPIFSVNSNILSN